MIPLLEIYVSKLSTRQPFAFRMLSECKNLGNPHCNTIRYDAIQ